MGCMSVRPASNAHPPDLDQADVLVGVPHADLHPRQRLGRLEREPPTRRASRSMCTNSRCCSKASTSLARIEAAMETATARPRDDALTIDDIRSRRASHPLRIHAGEGSNATVWCAASSSVACMKQGAATSTRCCDRLARSAIESGVRRPARARTVGWLRRAPRAREQRRARGPGGAPEPETP
jgi:hypothetical protein